MKIKHSYLRISILTIILAVSTITGYLHQISKRFPPVDAFCPFGGLESAYHFLRYGMIIKRVALSSFILLLVTIAAAVIMRRSFCGYICPLGTMQELFGKLGRKLKIKQITVPVKADKILRFLKYPVLAGFLYLSWISGALVIRAFDPWAAYHHIYSTEVFTKFLGGFIILVLSILIAPFYERVFCKYLCPMGGFLAIFNRLSFFRIKRDKESCIDCGICSAKCQMNIDVMRLDEVKSSECISCNECVESCPVEKTLYITSPAVKKRFTIKPVYILLITLILFTSVIGISSVSGSFEWKRNFGMPGKMARLIDGPDKIRNDNTFQEICIIFRIHPLVMAEKFSLEGENDFYSPIKDLGISPEEIFIFIEELSADQEKRAEGDACSPSGC